MKKGVVVALILGLIASALVVAPAEAGKKKKKKVTREVTVEYQAPALGTPESGGVCLRPTNSCGDIPVGATEKFVLVEITDATGTPVAVNLGQDTDPNTLGTEVDLGTYCGTTEVPIPMEPGYTIVVFPWAFGGGTCPGAVATTGSVTATMSNLP